MKASRYPSSFQRTDNHSQLTDSPAEFFRRRIGIGHAQRLGVAAGIDIAGIDEDASRYGFAEEHALTLKGQPASLGQTVSKACIVTWMNPQAILDGTMLLGAFRITLPAAEATTFLTGVLLASGLWFLSLTGCVAAFRHAITPRILRAINVLCGTVLMLYGLHLGYTFVQFFQI